MDRQLLRCSVGRRRSCFHMLVTVLILAGVDPSGSLRIHGSFRGEQLEVRIPASIATIGYGMISQRAENASVPFYTNSSNVSAHLGQLISNKPLSGLARMVSSKHVPYGAYAVSWKFQRGNRILMFMFVLTFPFCVVALMLGVLFLADQLCPVAFEAQPRRTQPPRQFQNIPQGSVFQNTPENNTVFQAMSHR